MSRDYGIKCSDSLHMGMTIIDRVFGMGVGRASSVYARMLVSKKLRTLVQLLAVEAPAAAGAARDQ